VEQLSPLRRSILQRTALAAIGATAAVVTMVAATYHRHFTWFAGECSVGAPRSWLSGVGSSLEMHVALGPLSANALDSAGCIVIAGALLAALVPTRISIRGQLVGAVVVLMVVLLPMVLTLNHWSWSVPEPIVPCPSGRPAL
jgi:hypothetical protein